MRESIAIKKKGDKCCKKMFTLKVIKDGTRFENLRSGFKRQTSKINWHFYSHC